MSKRPADSGNHKLNRLNVEMTSSSVLSSPNASPQSQKSTLSLLSFSKTGSRSLSLSSSASASSSALRGDPFASKTRFDRLKWNPVINQPEEIPC